MSHVADLFQLLISLFTDVILSSSFFRQFDSARAKKRKRRGLLSPPPPALRLRSINPPRFLFTYERATISN